MIIHDPNFGRLKETLFGGQTDRVVLGEAFIDEGAKETFFGKPVNDLSENLEFHIRADHDYIILD